MQENLLCILSKKSVEATLKIVRSLIVFYSKIVYNEKRSTWRKKYDRRSALSQNFLMVP